MFVCLIEIIVSSVLYIDIDFFSNINSFHAAF